MRDPILEMQVDELCNLDTRREPTEKETYDIYCWIDSLEFSRPKKNITRDFSDGVLMAELIAQYVPKFVDIRNFYAALSKKNKANNWEHLNRKVLRKLGLKVEKQKLNDIMENKSGAIEKVLFDLRPLLARRNRSILNYRQGIKPETPAPELSQAVSNSSIKSTSKSNYKLYKPSSQEVLRPQSQPRPAGRARQMHQTPSPKPKNDTRPITIGLKKSSPNLKTAELPQNKVKVEKKPEKMVKPSNCILARPVSSNKTTDKKATVPKPVAKPVELMEHTEKEEEAPSQVADIEVEINTKKQEKVEHLQQQIELWTSQETPTDSEKIELWTAPETPAGYTVYTEEFSLYGTRSRPPTAPGRNAGQNGADLQESVQRGLNTFV